jgi:hypothetical protein
MSREFRSYPERSTAIVRAFGPVLQRSSVGGALVAATMAVAWIFLRPELGPIPEPLVAAPVAGAVATAVAFLLVPRRVHRAFEAFSWLGRLELDRFRERTGGPAPASAEQIDAWFAAHPLAPAVVLPRVELLAFVGRYDDARRELATLEPSLETAFERASLIQYIDWLETGAPGVDDLRWAAGTAGQGSEARLVADVTVALAEARERAVRDDPEWFAPLETVRGRLGLAPRRVVLRDTWGKAGVAFTLVGFIAGMGASLLRFLL